MALNELMNHVATKYGIGNYRYPSFFLALIGNDPDEFSDGFSFSFNPFVDFAAHLVHDEKSLPVIWVKHPEELESARLEHEEDPVSYLELHVSGNLSAALITNSWLEALIMAGARPNTELDIQNLHEWFLRGLKITLSDLSPESQQFLSRFLGT